MIYRKLPGQSRWKLHHVQPDSVEAQKELLVWLRDHYPAVSWKILDII